MVPDLEVPFIILLQGFQDSDRLVLHSLLGGLTLGTLIAVAITVFVYAPLTSALFPINKQRLKEKCVFSRGLILSCILGVLSHVLLDVTNHAYNPVFWPFFPLNQAINPITPLLGGAGTASLLVHGLMVVLFVGLFFSKRKNFWERLLVE